MSVHGQDGGTSIDGQDDLVVLLDERRRPIGTAPRASVHSTRTPLHLAFSCYAFDPGGRLLVTRRALGKKTWPGVWTNTCCGHPRPGEQPADAVTRRLREELGLAAVAVELVLPDFAYEATMFDGIKENEVCPVFRAAVEADPHPDPDEVAEWRWVAWDDFAAAVTRAPWLVSPWAALQVPLLLDRPRRALTRAAAR
jgi:isopentenyl-diphosphate Delta-isomerase